MSENQTAEGKEAFRALKEQVNEMVLDSDAQAKQRLAAYDKKAPKKLKQNLLVNLIRLTL